MTFFTRRGTQDERDERDAALASSAPTIENEETTPPPLTLAQPIGFATVLGPHTEMTGSMRCEANARLDGSFSGEMKIGGNVLVGETARISADIHARNVSVAGAVRGNIRGRKVQLLRTSRVWGDIEATALTTEEGAFIDGKITMVSHEAARVEAPGFDPPADVADVDEDSDAPKDSPGAPVMDANEQASD